MMEYKWEIKPQGNEREINHIAEILGIEKSLANLLVQRGIKTFDAARTFFRPQLKELHDPFLMKGMEEAVTRIKAAIDNKEGILIYGDYDVDGTTSVALVYSFLHTFYSNLGYYIPDRYTEGYGISYQGIDFAIEKNYSLIIALDCGIKAVEKIKFAKEKGIDFIICDHHQPGDILPEAVALLDAKQPDCKYPYKELSGCGVGFKLISAYLIKHPPAEIIQKRKGRRSLIEYLYDYLVEYIDLVAVSIASDIVPITGENRILAYYGLKRLNSKPRIGLQTIIKIANADTRVLTISDLVFKIGPRINAAGRIKSGEKAVNLLTTDNFDLAMEMSREINQFNTIRKDLDHNITEEALALIEKSEMYDDKKTTVVFNKEWHKGVIGIVASRLTESYYRPTVVLTESHGLATGSARSVMGFDLYEAISQCSDLLEAYGGHKYAAGLTLKIENVEPFIQKFEKVVSGIIDPDQLIPQVEIDAIIKFKDITPKFYRILKQFAPFGPENMKPVFMTKYVVDTGGSRIVGNAREHLKLEITDGQVQMSGIAFGFAYFYEFIKTGKSFDVCYTIEENEFRGTTTLQLMIRDMISSQ
jgi:single-stranded-DNA-specific exonuclease